MGVRPVHDNRIAGNHSRPEDPRGPTDPSIARDPSIITSRITADNCVVQYPSIPVDPSITGNHSIAGDLSISIDHSVADDMGFIEDPSIGTDKYGVRHICRVSDPAAAKAVLVSRDGAGAEIEGLVHLCLLDHVLSIW